MHTLCTHYAHAGHTLYMKRAIVALLSFTLYAFFSLFLGFGQTQRSMKNLTKKKMNTGTVA